MDQMKHQTSLPKLEKLLGVTFTDRERLALALTHSSLQQGRDAANYERLEFLGDRVLGMAVAERLFALYPDADEGELSVRLNMLVSAETCALVADEIDLARFIRFGVDLKNLADARTRSIRADVVEALIAAVYLDHGYEVARDFILRHWEHRLHSAASARRDPKTELQEWAHRATGAAPSYELLERSGPDHEPVFTVRASVKGFAAETGKGRSKRQAETEAASRILLREGVWKSN
ncbi:ribonuclease III [Aureimonas fodinaquatilis]|uniref:Ribonuclease 3 n=1 Tax=Aureimonas fodinaquatilis TaxID=2565783 RepID=A0A5B0E0P2_9HYPH|nr:ribonuclease III [Aureimonas fodinaquatilis]KAA0971029.1 ribonuclease III [Aureimonas fodinaquatilis]